MNVAIEDVIPHREGMLLLDRLTHHDAASVIAQAEVRSERWYADAEGNMPGWVGIELMAQAVAAWVGMTARAAGLPVRQGVLLGTRKYACETPAFPQGACLTVTARPAFRDEDGMGVFDCDIALEGRQLASASINVFEPLDFAAFLAERRGRH